MSDYIIDAPQSDQPAQPPDVDYIPPVPQADYVPVDPDALRGEGFTRGIALFMGLSAVLPIISAFMLCVVYPGETFSNMDLFDILVRILQLSVEVLAVVLVFFLWKGRNWARITNLVVKIVIAAFYLIVTVIGLARGLSTVEFYMWLNVALTILSEGTGLFIAIFLFAYKPCKAFFASAK